MKRASKSLSTKKSIVFLCIAVAALSGCNASKRGNAAESTRTEVADPAHNSRNSLDWAGVYKGLTPCADCPGIEDEIRLNDDLTYERLMVYLERGDNRFLDHGRFEWDETGGRIRLISADAPEQAGNWFRVGENRLFMLDTEGNPIESNIPSEMYTYQKIDLDHVITEKYWKLIELNGKPIAPAEEGRREAHFILKNEDNRVTGSTGCNVMKGSYSLPGENAIRFSRMATTRMGCIDIEYEQEYLNVFEDCDGYIIQNDVLTLSKEEVPLARFEAVYLY